MKLGQELSNEEIIKFFKCGVRGGMRRSVRTNTLVIVSDHTKKFYSDSWDNGIFRYAGMGQTGNQSLIFAQNKTLNESDTNGVDVHLFEVYTEGKYIYQGQVELAGKPYQEMQPDFKGDNRTVWIFPLKLTNRALPAIVPEETFEKRTSQQRKENQTPVKCRTSQKNSPINEESSNSENSFKPATKKQSLTHKTENRTKPKTHHHFLKSLECFHRSSKGNVLPGRVMLRDVCTSKFFDYVGQDLHIILVVFKDFLVKWFISFNMSVVT